jgi:RNA polymerase sigma factor (TIGR02999 family)
VAARELRKERKNISLQPTELANEAWLVLQRQRNLTPADRSRYLGAAARTIHRVLVDHARRRKRLKRGGDDGRQVSIAMGELHQPQRTVDFVDLLALEDALSRLAALSPRAASVVELRFYGGLAHNEIAAEFGVSVRTVVDDWTTARAWLLKELGGYGGRFS